MEDAKWVLNYQIKQKKVDKKMKVKLEEKYQEIQRTVYLNNKVDGNDIGVRATNQLLETVSNMIAEAIQLSEKDK